MHKFVTLLLASLAVGTDAKQAASRAWAPKLFPNPQFDTSKCGRPGVKISWLCDPDSIISSDSRNVVEGIIQKIAIGDAPYSKSSCGSLGEVGSQVGVALMREFEVPVGKTPAQTAEIFARGLHDEWRVGHAQCLDGVLLLLSKDNRQMYISTGTGIMSRLSSSVVDTIIMNARPLLQANRFDDAVEAAVVDIGLALAGRLTPAGHGDTDSEEGFASLLPLGLFIGIFSLAGSASFFRERKQRKRFSDCKSKLEKLKKDQAAARLDPHFNATSCPICLEDFTVPPGAETKQDQTVSTLEDDEPTSELESLLPGTHTFPLPKTAAASFSLAPSNTVPSSATQASRKRPWYNPWAAQPKQSTPEAGILRNPLILPCRHAFCEPCISTWVDGGKVTCPVCRVHLDGSSPAPAGANPDLPQQPQRPQQQPGADFSDSNQAQGSQGQPGPSCSAGMGGGSAESLAERQRRQAWYDQLLMAEMMFRMRSLHTQYPDFVSPGMVDSMTQDVQQGREVSAESTRSFQLTNPALRLQNMSSGSHGMSSGFGGGSSGGGGGGSW